MPLQHVVTKVYHIAQTSRRLSARKLENFASDYPISTSSLNVFLAKRLQPLECF